jgi:hypothetical protein
MTTNNANNDHVRDDRSHGTRSMISIPFEKHDLQFWLSSRFCLRAVRASCRLAADGCGDHDHGH